MTESHKPQVIKAKFVERVATSFGLLMTAVGWSVGAGNYWRFSWRAANYGGGSFLFAYLVWLIVVAFVMASAEYAIGKVGRGGCLIGPYNAVPKYRKLAALGGIWMAWSDFMILGYYWVVTGWIFYYLLHAIAGTFVQPGFDAMKLWKDFAWSPLALAIGVLMMVFDIIVTAFGIKGIEKVCKVMFPILFLGTMGLAIYAVLLPGAIKGLEFYMIPRAEALADPATWMQSLSQVIWSIGIAWGFFITLGADFRERDDIVGISFGNVVNDTSVAWLAGTAIIPLIFAISPTPYEHIKQAGTGLAFIALPSLFNRMGGVAGYLYGLVFFIAFFFAAFTSLITIHEVVIKILKDLGMKPSLASISTGILATLIGIPTALSFDWLDYYDTVWGVVGLTVGLIFLSLIVGYLGNTEEFRKALNDINPPPLFRVGKWWNALVKFNIIIPLIFFVWWIAYWEWIRGWDAGLHTYYTFPGMLILIVGGIMLYVFVSKTIDRVVGGS